jgi:histidine triad (HIT) family protein
MTVFSKIIAGDIPSYKCAEDDRFYAFLDINPVAKGHTLVVPKHEVDYIFDISDEELAAMTIFAKRVAKAIKTACPCKKVGVAVLGLEVAHAHIHLIPLKSEGDMDFRREKLQLPADEMAATASAILNAFEAEK